jgi:hypothetical protein
MGPMRSISDAATIILKAHSFSRRRDTLVECNSPSSP